MTKLSQTEPLKTIQINNICIVQTHVHEPFLDRRHSKVRLELQIHKLFGQLELLLAKIHRLEIWKGSLRTSSDTLLKTLYENVDKTESSILSLWSQNKTTTPAQTEFIQNMSGKGLYKKAVEYMMHRQVSMVITESGSQVMGHSMQFAYLHQLYTIASRLYHDLALTNHKYIAYQLALLYQCINRQGVDFVEYKARIEQRFDEIKTATKQTTPIVLEKDQIKWLQDLTLSIIMKVIEKESVFRCGSLFHAINEIGN